MSAPQSPRHGLEAASACAEAGAACWENPVPSTQGLTETGPASPDLTRTRQRQACARAAVTSALGGPATSVKTWTRSRPVLHGGSRAAWPGMPLFHSSGRASESGRLVLITRCLHSETDSGALRG